MPEPQIIARHPLANGLTLEVLDHSRPVAGDRWLVICEVRIAVPVSAATLPQDLQPQAEAVAAALGNPVVFSRRDERNFIAASEVAALRQEMARHALDLAPAYYGHPDFAGRFIRQQFSQWQQERQLRRGK